MQDAINKVRSDLKKQDEKPSIKDVKKKLGVGKKKKGAKVDKFEMALVEDKMEKLKV